VNAIDCAVGGGGGGGEVEVEVIIDVMDDEASLYKMR
jgi:hypothetical protein